MSHHHGHETTRASLPIRRLVFDALEERCLLHGASLDVLGTNRANVIALTVNDQTGMIEVRVDGVNPVPANPSGFDPADLESIHIRGLRGRDTITVDAAIQLPAEIFGDAGNDAITGGSGPDSIDGGSGRDSIDGAAGDDKLVGGTSHDVVNGGDGNDDLSGDTGNDKLNGDDRDDVLRPGRGRDSLTGGTGAWTSIRPKTWK